MSYADIENSVDSGRPLFFYEFVYDAEATYTAWRYVADTEQRIYGGKVWAPFPIKHSEITLSGSLDRQTLTVTARNDIPLSNVLISRPPSRVVLLNIYRAHLGDTEMVMEWTGRVLSGNWVSSAEAEFSCEPISTSQQAIGLRRKYQRGCPHALYGSSCRADKSAHTESGNASMIEDSMTVTVALTGTDTGFNTTNMAGGIFRITLETGLMEIRAISRAEAIGPRTWKLHLIAPIYDMAAGQAVSVSKGCLHTFAVCRDTFNNAKNYGGCPNIPTTDPFVYNQF